MSESRWRSSPLPTLLTLLKSGGTPDTSRLDFYGGDIPFVAIEDMTGCNKFLSSTAKTLTEEGLKSSSAWLVPEGAILYSIYATLGVPRINTTPVATNQAILAMLCRPNRVDRDFLFYWLDNVRDSIVNAVSSQTTQKNLSGTLVKAFVVDHPEDVLEQSKIAEVLSTVDWAIEQTEALIAKQQRIKTGLMQDLLTRGIDEHGNLRSEATHKCIPFGDCWRARPQNGLYKPQSQYSADGTPIVRIDGFHNGDLIDHQTFRRVRLAPTELRAFALETGDLLVNRVNSMEWLGKAALVGSLLEATVFESNMMRIRVGAQRMIPEFAILLLSSPHAYRHFLRCAKTAIAQASINQEDVRSLLVAVPLRAEQEKIVDGVQAIRRVEERLTEAAFKLRLLKTGLMQNLLTGDRRVTALLQKGVTA
jgi:type I restriction enzyme S subunit